MNGDRRRQADGDGGWSLLDPVRPDPLAAGEPDGYSDAPWYDRRPSGRTAADDRGDDRGNGRDHRYDAPESFRPGEFDRSWSSGLAGPAQDAGDPRPGAGAAWSEYDRADDRYGPDGRGRDERHGYAPRPVPDAAPTGRRAAPDRPTPVDDGAPGGGRRARQIPETERGRYDDGRGLPGPGVSPGARPEPGWTPPGRPPAPGPDGVGPDQRFRRGEARRGRGPEGYEGVEGYEGRGYDERGHDGRRDDDRGYAGRGYDDRGHTGRGYDGRGDDDRGHAGRGDEDRGYDDRFRDDPRAPEAPHGHGRPGRHGPVAYAPAGPVPTAPAPMAPAGPAPMPPAGPAPTPPAGRHGGPGPGPDGVAPEAFDGDGYNLDGLGRDGFDRDGFDLYGFDREGFDRYGFDREGYDRDGYPADAYGYDEDDAAGYDPRRADDHGYDPRQADAYGYAPGHGPDGYRPGRRRAYGDGDYDDEYGDDYGPGPEGTLSGGEMPAVADDGEPEERSTRASRRGAGDKERRRWPWMVGAAAAAAAVAVPVGMSLLGGSDEGSAARDAPLLSGGAGTAGLGATGAGQPAAPGAPADGAAAQPAGGQVTYEVNGSGKAGSITFGRGDAVAQLQDAPLPWKQDSPAASGASDYNLSAVSGGGDVSCKILLNGAVIAEDSAKGDYAAVSCNGRR